MRIIRPPRILREYYKNVVWRLGAPGKTVYLTFDDGPTPGVTEWVLNELKKYNARATFFCIGRNVEKHKELYHQIIQEGHHTGNHTYSHIKGIKVKNYEYYNDVFLAEQFIESDLFRPPYGLLKSTQIKWLSGKYKIILWDVLSYDFSRKMSKKKCLHNVIKKTRNGSVIVFHDSLKAREKLFYVLPQLLKNLSDRGYDFKVLNNKKI